jgi:N-methylhydantoinase A/oxoprolinase/acetone carboxylase beta subunit
MADWTLLNGYMNEMEAEGMAFLASAGVADLSGGTTQSRATTATITRTADMRYSGQGHEISVEIPNGILSDESIARIEENFKKEYQLRYGKTIDDIGIEAVTWRVVVRGPVPQVMPKQEVPTSQNSEHALKGYREIYLMGDKTASTVPVYHRYQLQPTDCFDGPAIIEEMESTFVVGANATVRIDEFRNIVVEMHY